MSKSYHNLRLKEKALKLRTAGLSYKEILKKVPVAKSTISLWCRAVDLTIKQRKRLTDKSRMRGLVGIKAIQTMFWKKRCESFLEGVNLSKRLANKDPELVAGLMLYWAEGTKSNIAAVTNSDSRIISYMVKWFGRYFKVKPQQFSVGLHLHPGQDENEIKNYWSKLTGIPLINFRKSFIKVRGSGYRKNRLQNGVAKIAVRMEGSTYLLFKVLGAINGYLNKSLQEPIVPENWMSVMTYAKKI
jgi:hypothetical protein